jgi:putative ABC transport system ATP-binding protein
MIELEGVEKVYKRGSEDVHALRGIDLSLSRNEFVSIIGPSGSGKTTLLQILGCLDTPTSGSVRFDGQEIDRKKESELVAIRRKKIGFIFQQFYLMPGLSVFDNVALPLLFSKSAVHRDHILSLIDTVGLSSRVSHTPGQLSGGEMQRVAIARALVNNPEIILADEPTGNLDSDNSARITELLKSLHDKGITVVMVTHNNDLAAKADRIIVLRDGRITDEQVAAESTCEQQNIKNSEDLIMASS